MNKVLLSDNLAKKMVYKNPGMVVKLISVRVNHEERTDL